MLDLTRLVLQVRCVNNGLTVLSLQVELEHALHFIDQICVLADSLGHSFKHRLGLQSSRTGTGSNAASVQLDASVVDHNLTEVIVTTSTAARFTFNDTYDIALLDFSDEDDAVAFLPHLSNESLAREDRTGKAGLDELEVLGLVVAELVQHGSTKVDR